MKDPETPLPGSPGLSSEGTKKRRVMHRSGLLAGFNTLQVIHQER